MDQISTPDYEFDGFRLDTALQILFAPTGDPVPLPSRAFETLKYLVERSGELVDKADLMKAVWPRAVVEENNLSQCIVTLRRTLGEAAGERRFILTVPGRGFKFVAPVTVVPHVRFEASAAPPPSNAPDESAPTPSARRRSRARLGVAVTGGVLVAIIAAALVWRGTEPVTVPAEYEALTDVVDSATAPVLSADGHMMAFVRGDGPFLSAGQIWLKLLPDGEPVQLTHTAGLVFAPTFTPDGTHVAYSAVEQPASATTWETFVVPITGGAPRQFLPNASGLTFIGPHAVMYSEFKAGLHLGIVSSLDDRSNHHDVYLPAHDRGMAHYSYLSPDRKSVVVVEMDLTGAFKRCRLVPFDGSSPGNPVGPSGACISAAWSPDGTWMYFSVGIAGHSHLWRQRFPKGLPQQITFGPTDEETVAVTPDGRSLLTSLGREQSTLWMHDATGERSLTDESHAYSPWLSSDGKRVYFLTARGSVESTELWRLDIATGRKEALLTGFAVRTFDISFDERRVVFTTRPDGLPQIWIAPLDRRTQPQILIRGGDEAVFDAAGDVYFRHLGERANYLHFVHADGAGEKRLIETPIVEFHSVAPDGRWASADLPLEGAIGAGWLLPLREGAPKLIRNGWWPSRWSRDGKRLYLEVGLEGDTQRHGRTAVLSIGTDGLPFEPLGAAAPGIPLIPQAEASLSVGMDPSFYVYAKDEVRRNIYRIPLHR
jgi:DNA-binding winged helix-turn-helix (wHTH) protein/Tol biopolymer transport system component